MYRKKEILSDNEKILLSRIYKLDRQIKAFVIHHKDESMNKLLPQTDFIKKASELYNQMSKKLIDISLRETKYTHNIVNLDDIIRNKKL